MPIIRLRYPWDRRVRLLREWWARNPSLTRFLPAWANKRLQKLGEWHRSRKAQQEPQTNLPFPYNDADSLTAFEQNKLAAEPDFEVYWKEQQRLVDLGYLYRRVPLLRGYGQAIYSSDNLTLEPQ